MTSEAAQDLKRALENAEIVPYYQPQVELRTGRIVGFEVLARWRHPTRHIVHPAEFVPVAEEAGLIGSLTEHLLRQAGAAAADWPADIQLSVNISPLQLHDPALPERLQHAAEQAGIAFNRLTFEVTEAAVVEDFLCARDVLGNLKALGADIALDDFGTGYSGLRHLQMLPFDKLKLDAAFVRNMTTQRESRKIVASVVGLCQGLGLASIAEGIENESQADMLRCLGCNVGQGWLFGRPVPAARAADMVREARPGPVQPIARIAEQVALRLEAVPGQCMGQLQALYDGAPVGLGFLDTHLRYRALNERLADMHGRPVAAHLGRTVTEVVPEQSKWIEVRARRALAGEAVTDFTTHRRRPDEPVAHVMLASYQPVRDVGGEIIGVSVALVDVTEAGQAGASAGTIDHVPAYPRPKLTTRQCDVLALLADGHSIKQIARRLGLGVGTVKTHVARIYTALGARNRVEAIKRSGFAAGPEPQTPRQG